VGLHFNPADGGLGWPVSVRFYYVPTRQQLKTCKCFFSFFSFHFPSVACHANNMGVCPFPYTPLFLLPTSFPFSRVMGEEKEKKSRTD
jgi:hypothetical protein